MTLGINPRTQEGEMFKKMTVLAMAVGVVAALALPASASAEWKDNGIKVNENVDIPFTGTAEFTSGIGGIRCQVTSTATFAPGQTGEIDSFTPHPTSDTANCVGTGGLAFCQVHNLTPTLPHHGHASAGNWVFHTGANNTIAITYGEIHSEVTGGFCPLKKVTVTPGTATATPNQPTAVTNIQLSGAAAIDIMTSGQEVYEPLNNPHIGGTLTIEANSGKAHTYDV